MIWAQRFKDLLWLDSNSEFQESPLQYSSFDAALAVGARQRISMSGRGSLHALRDLIQSNRDYLFGYLGYDLKNELEDLCSENPDPLQFPELYFFQPEKLFIWKGDQLELCYLKDIAGEMDKDVRDILNERPTQAVPGTKPRIRPRISREEYYDRMRKILEHIHRGDIYEVNFCQEFFAEQCSIDPVAVYEKLNRVSRAPFACFLRDGEKYLICSSPERFVRKEGNHLISQPIKGTAKRHSDPAEDAGARDRLASDPKERTENIMIVDLVRNDMSRSAIPGSVSVEELCGVYTFRQVHQLISTVTSRVDETADPIDLIKDLFPMGSMTGAPKISAMKIIEEQEVTKRGLFSGAVGYFTPDGDFDLNVVIRSIQYNREEAYLSISAGSAVTSSSEIENEYEECLIKARALIQALE